MTNFNYEDYEKELFESNYNFITNWNNTPVDKLKPKIRINDNDGFIGMVMPSGAMHYIRKPLAEDFLKKGNMFQGVSGKEYLKKHLMYIERKLEENPDDEQYIYNLRKSTNLPINADRRADEKRAATLNDTHYHKQILFIQTIDDVIVCLLPDYEKPFLIKNNHGSDLSLPEIVKTFDWDKKLSEHYEYPIKLNYKYLKFIMGVPEIFYEHKLNYIVINLPSKDLFKYKIENKSDLTCITNPTGTLRIFYNTLKGNLNKEYANQLIQSHNSDVYEDLSYIQNGFYTFQYDFNKYFSYVLNDDYFILIESDNLSRLRKIIKSIKIGNEQKVINHEEKVIHLPSNMDNSQLNGFLSEENSPLFSIDEFVDNISSEGSNGGETPIEEEDSLEIRGLDDLENDLREVENTLNELDGKTINLTVDVNEEDNEDTTVNNEEDVTSNETVNVTPIDINKASLQEINNLPEINLIKAKKLLQYREEAIYIKSIDDLKEKLNLNDTQIEKIKPYIIINKEEERSSTSFVGRRVDI